MDVTPCSCVDALLQFQCWRVSQASNYEVTKCYWLLSWLRCLQGRPLLVLKRGSQNGFDILLCVSILFGISEYKQR
jgi:hypothetical protein